MRRSHRRPAILALLVLSVASCQRAEQRPRPAPSTTSSTPSPPAARPAAAQPRVDVGVGAGVGELGMPELPPPLSQAGLHLNEEGLKAHRAGNFQRSSELFRQAVAADRGYTLARFNAATALARLGDHAGCERELHALLAQDLPEFGPRLLKDPDLEAFRSTEQGATLLAYLSTLKQEWLARAATGVAGQLWRRHVPSSSPDSYETAHQRPESIRFGVYLAKQDRFLPLLPRLPSALGAALDVKASSAAVLEGKVDGCQTDSCPRLSRPSLVLFPTLDPTPSAPPLRRTADNELAEVVPGAHVELTLVDGTARLRRAGHDGPWRIVVGPSPTTSSTAPAQSLNMGPLGNFLSGAPKGFKIERGSLVGPTGSTTLAQELQADWYQLEVFSDQRRAILVGTRYGCACEDGTARRRFSHVVADVDLVGSKAQPWLKGNGPATVRLGPDDSIYVQRGEVVERYEGIRATPSETMPGFALISPLLGAPECCGL